MKIYESTYKGIPSFVMESDGLCLEVVCKGGRIVSLIDLQSGREFLVQQKGDVFCAGPYDELMTDYEPAGFDDMFPTISPCYYEDYPWTGIPLPDHGELWSLDWKPAVHEDYITFETFGVRLPYRFSKTIQLIGEKTLNVKYEVENLSGFDMHYIWAAHPMIRAQEGMEFWLPNHSGEAVCMLSFDKRLGEYGDIVSWPEHVDVAGKHHRLDRLRSLDAASTEKYYFKNPLQEGIFIMRYPSDDTVVTLVFPEDKVPYFGLLIEEGGWANELYVIPEPCTAPYDRIDVAKLHGKVSVLPAGKVRDWYLDISISKDFFTKRRQQEC